jgi:recyclin-1
MASNSNRNSLSKGHRKGNSIAVSNATVLASLRATQLVTSSAATNGTNPERAVLPAEILELILEYLHVVDLISFARTAKRMQEMVYEDARWVKRLSRMSVWDEGEARKRSEQTRNAGVANGQKHERKGSTLFDATTEEREKLKEKTMSIGRPPLGVSHGGGRTESGFDETVVVAGSKGPQPSGKNKALDPVMASNVLSRVRSIRGYARQEYGKVHEALGPLYFDIARSKSHADPIIFQKYRDPEQQAQMLAQLRQFAKSDCAAGWDLREQKLETMIGIFENAALREFEQGMTASDTAGRMKRYAQVLVVLNGGAAAIDTFIQNNPVMLKKDDFGHPLECIRTAFTGHVNLAPSELFFTRLAGMMNEQVEVVGKVWPAKIDIMTPFLERVGEEIIAEYVTVLFDEAHEQNTESYLKAVSGVFQQALRFSISVQPAKSSPKSFRESTKAVVIRAFEQHVDLYLQDELEFFNKHSQTEVDNWEQRLQEHEKSEESFYMSNVSRQAAKQDFLSSFKKMVMFPVTAVGSLTTTSSTTKKQPTVDINGLPINNRASTPVPIDRSGAGTPSQDAPTSELAAKAAIMNSRLEGIKTLFSIEVALDLVHSAKSSIERAAIFVQLGGRMGDEAREQCEAIFVSLLKLLGQRHIRSGFDKAVNHLSVYNPRESGGGAEPLVTFLELVNVGDLIQQMVDVFYVQELVAPKLSDDNDFLSPAVKEKKRFESMLDERVAAGLNKGIDVLMDEVEFICGSTQKPTDFNPLPGPDGKVMLIDIGPTETAQSVVEVVAKHVGMLVGSTDKNVLDVFNQEVGVRLFTVLCKHIKRQRISVDGAIVLIRYVHLLYPYPHL